MEITGTFVILVPIIMALVQVIRGLGLDVRFAPVAAIALGIVGAVGLDVFSFSTVLSGIVVGLTASGIYSGVKTTVKG